MQKHPARAAMEVAIRKVVVPQLRARGFRGRLPHFRRLGEGRIDLLTFQFYSSGGSFVVEVATCGPEGSRWSGPTTVTAHDIDQRLRLGSDGKGDHWFVYGPRNHDAAHDRVEPQRHYVRIAEAVAGLIDAQGEAYWRESDKTGTDAASGPVDRRR